MTSQVNKDEYKQQMVCIAACEEVAKRMQHYKTQQSDAALAELLSNLCRAQDKFETLELIQEEIRTDNFKHDGINNQTPECDAHGGA